MESPPLELGEVLEEDRHERRDVVSSILGRTLQMYLVKKGSDVTEGSSRTMVSPYSAYENPTPTGWSTKKMFA